VSEFFTLNLTEHRPLDRNYLKRRNYFGNAPAGTKIASSCGKVNGKHLMLQGGRRDHAKFSSIEPAVDCATRIAVGGVRRVGNCAAIGDRPGECPCDPRHRRHTECGERRDRPEFGTEPRGRPAQPEHDDFWRVQQRSVRK